MSRNNPSELHKRAQQDSDLGPPSKWPRREKDRRNATFRVSRGKGRRAMGSRLDVLHRDLPTKPKWLDD